MVCLASKRSYFSSNPTAGSRFPAFPLFSFAPNNAPLPDPEIKTQQSIPSMLLGKSRSFLPEFFPTSPNIPQLKRQMAVHCLKMFSAQKKSDTLSTKPYETHTINHLAPCIPCPLQQWGWQLQCGTHESTYTLPYPTKVSNQGHTHFYKQSLHSGRLEHTGVTDNFAFITKLQLQRNKNFLASFV